MLKQIFNFFKPKKEEKLFTSRHMPFYTESNWNYLEDYLNSQSDNQYTEYVIDLVLALKKSIQPVKHRLTSLLRLNNLEVFNCLTDKELEVFYDEMCEYKKRVRVLKYRGKETGIDNEFENRVFFESKPFTSGELRMDDFYFQYFENFVENLNEKFDKKAKISQNFVKVKSLQNKTEKIGPIIQIKQEYKPKRELDFDKNESKRIKKVKSFITPIKQDTSFYVLHRKINLNEFYKLDNPYYTCMEGENKVIKGRVPLEMTYFYNKFVKKEPIKEEKKMFYLPKKREENEINFNKREDYMYIKEKEEFIDVKQSNKLRKVINYYKNKFDKTEIESIIKNVEVIDKEKSVNILKTDEFIKNDLTDKSNDSIKQPINLFAEESKIKEMNDFINKSSEIKNNLLINEERDIKPINLFNTGKESEEKFKPIDLFNIGREKEEKKEDKNVIGQTKPIDLFSNVKETEENNKPLDLFKTGKEGEEKKQDKNIDGQTKPIDLFNSFKQTEEKEETKTEKDKFIKPIDLFRKTEKTDKLNKTKNESIQEIILPLDLFNNSKQNEVIQEKNENKQFKSESVNFNTKEIKSVDLFKSQEIKETTTEKSPLFDFNKPINDSIKPIQNNFTVNLFNKKEENNFINKISQSENNKPIINLFEKSNQPMNNTEKTNQFNFLKPIDLFSKQQTNDFNFNKNVNLNQKNDLIDNKSVNLFQKSSEKTSIIEPVNLFPSTETKSIFPSVNPINSFNNVNNPINSSNTDNTSMNLNNNPMNLNNKPMNIFSGTENKNIFSSVQPTNQNNLNLSNDKPSNFTQPVNLSFNMFSNNKIQSFNLFDNISKKESSTVNIPKEINQSDTNLLNLPKRTFNFSESKIEEQKKKRTLEDLESNKKK